ncbi:hypothetical protein KM043_008412 [Ampulex compressa]|nr:hypothetical protein KM043_008412 [Ampulex compressa]
MPSSLSKHRVNPPPDGTKPAAPRLVRKETPGTASGRFESKCDDKGMPASRAAARQECGRTSIDPLRTAEGTNEQVALSSSTYLRCTKKRGDRPEGYAIFYRAAPRSPMFRLTMPLAVSPSVASGGSRKGKLKYYVMASPGIFSTRSGRVQLNRKRQGEGGGTAKGSDVDRLDSPARTIAPRLSAFSDEDDDDEDESLVAGPPIGVTRAIS